MIAKHAAFDRERLPGKPDRRHVGVPAERQAHALTHARVDHLRHGGGVADRRDRHVVELLLHDLGHHRHDVLRATRAAVVAVVDEQHRGAGIGKAEGLCVRDRLGKQRRAKYVLVAAVPRHVQHVRAHGAGVVAAAMARVAYHDRGDPGVGRIRVRERRQERCRQHGAVELHAPRESENVARRSVFRRVTHDRGQKRLPSPRHDRLDHAVERADENASREHARLVHVDVRIGLVAGDHGGVVDQRAGQVGVIVERDRDRHLRRDAAQALHDLAFGVVAILDHHGAVQIEEDGIAPRSHRVFQRLYQRLEGRPRRLVRGPRFGRDRRHDLGLLAPREIEVRGHRRIGALEAGTRFLAVRGTFAVPERGQWRGKRRERVGLVLDEADDELAAHHCSRRPARPASTAARGATASSGTSSDRPSPARAPRPRALPALSAESRRGSAPSS